MKEALLRISVREAVVIALLIIAVMGITMIGLAGCRIFRLRQYCAACWLTASLKAKVLPQWKPKWPKA